MSEKERLIKTIATVEAQRSSLGDAAVDAVLAGLRRQLATLEEQERQAARQTAQQTAGGERRIVTVLVCDVKGSTALAERLDPEAWTEIMDAAFDYLTDPVDRFGGTVAQLLGDGILALFGAPRAHEDDPQRAVMAGLAILESIKRFRLELRRKRGLDFNVRIGINTGLVVTQRIGTRKYEEYTALGDAVNMAERLEETARPGTMYVSEYTYKLLEGAFDFENAGEIEVEGKSRRVRAYRVIGRRKESAQTRGLESLGIATSFIGREAEKTQVEAAVENLFRDEGGILYLIGEAGVGKSRLIAELQRQFAGENLLWLSGRTLSYGQSISYWPFQEILRQLVDIREEDNERYSWNKLESKVRSLFPEDYVEVMPYLAGILSLEAWGQYAERVKYLDGNAMRDQILVASRRFFERLAEEKPLMLVFEDVQWIDASSVRLIDHLLPIVKRVPLLICGVGRPELSSEAEQLHQHILQDYDQNYTEIFLAPLSRVESLKLASQMLAVDDFSARAQQLIVRKGQGNPFFIEEIMRDLIEEGALVRESATGPWRATALIETISLPDTIKGVIAARIDRLDRAARGVLRAAAVIGQSFKLALLSAVLESEVSLQAGLAALMSAELIRLNQQSSEEEYIFKNALAREVAYERILLQKRRTLHKRVGQAIESLFADRLEEYYGLLAYHYAQAEEWQPAQDYLLKAGDQAVEVASGIEALNHYRRALKAYENAFGQDLEPLQRGTLSRKMGDAYYGLGRIPASRENYLETLAILDRPLPESRWGLFSGLAGQIVRQTLHRLLPKRFINLAAREKRDVLREVVDTYERLGVIFYLEGEAASAVYAFLRSLNLAEQAGASPELARAYANNVVAAGLIPPLRFLADRYSESASHIAQSCDDLATQAWVWQLTGIYCLGLGQWRKAMDAEKRAADLNRRIGRLRWWEESISTLAQALHYHGQYQRSLAIYHEVLESSRERGDLQIEVWSMTGLAETTLRVGAPGYEDEAIRCLKQAQSALQRYRYPNRTDEIQIYGLLGLVRARREEWHLAHRAADRAAELINIEWPPSTFYTLEAYASVSAAYMTLWQAQLDGRYTPPMPVDFAQKAKNGVKNLRNFGRIFPIAKPRATLARGALDWRLGKQGKARESWQKALVYAQDLDMSYEVGVAHFEIGRHLPTDDPHREEHLSQAGRIFAELGTIWDLAHVRQILPAPDR